MNSEKQSSRSKSPGDPDSKPVVRILHHMARTGGTVICRCLASMSKVVLLSEIHPLGRRMFDPLKQAHDWYGLLDDDEVAAASAGEFEFEQAIRLIVRRCEERNLNLILRDWSHLDFTGIPFMRPVYRSLLAESLDPAFELLRYSTVRHPLDQWLSLAANPVFRKKLSPEKYLEGALQFANLAVETGFVRFEDFTRGSDAALEVICSGLQLNFDPGYREKWSGYTNITGDVLPGRARAGQIQALPRKKGLGSLDDQLRASSVYSEILAVLEY